MASLLVHGGSDLMAITTDDLLRRTERGAPISIERGLIRQYMQRKLKRGNFQSEKGVYFFGAGKSKATANGGIWAARVRA